MTSRSASPDTEADRELRAILDNERLVGFTMVAGAGSGKTTSLVKALAHVSQTRGPALLAGTQRIACITYTEVAAREIHEDIGNDRLASVSTIHSFLWSLVKPFQKDIGKWVSGRIDERIAELLQKQNAYTPRTRSTTKEKDAADLEKRRHQQEAVKFVKQWTYGMGGDYARGVVGHADILKMVPQLILENALLARLVARQYPIIFVDESQDTFPQVVESLKRVWTLADGQMCLGFFGDPMQQIYPSGIGSVPLEAGWLNIEKPENFRSSRRVLECVNAVRSEGDMLQQSSGHAEVQIEGEAFCFVLLSDDRRSANLERVRSWLDANSKSGNWTRADHEGGSKILMIVHRMAAQRLGFEALYSAFHDNGSSSIGEAFDEGRAWPLTPFRDVILPICQLKDAGSPEMLSILKQFSPLVRDGLAAQDLRSTLSLGRKSVQQLRTLVENTSVATLGDIIRFAAEQRLVELDPRWGVYLYPDGEHRDVVLDENVVKVLDAMAQCSYTELEGYYTYVNQESPYSTQHGTKGSEFDRVVVVLDDEEGRYPLYSYDKFLGLRELSDTDIQNQAQGIDSAMERTRRLFYVCVSRAKESVAIVLFAKDVPAAVTAVSRSPFGNCVEILTDADILSTV